MTGTAYEPKVKICGLRDTESALAAADAGADYLGFNFVEGVRRQLQPRDGLMVIRNYRIRGHRREKRSGPKLVGLFRNQPIEVVNNVARLVDVDYVQICGDEDEDYIQRVWKPVFRQVRVKAGTAPAELDMAISPHLGAGRVVLLDTFDEKWPGGTGKRFDWASAEGVASKHGVLLAGGLTPGNVGEAIERLHPWGVDVASGVETDGVVDHEKVGRFIAAAKGRGRAVLTS